MTSFSSLARFESISIVAYFEHPLFFPISPIRVEHLVQGARWAPFRDLQSSSEAILDPLESQGTLNDGLIASDGLGSGWKAILARARRQRWPRWCRMGSYHGTCGLTGRLVSVAKAWEDHVGRGWSFWTEWDENSVNPSHFCNLYMSFVLLYHNLLRCICLHKVFGVNFESRDSDHTVVLRAPNNSGLDTSHVSKVLTAALGGSFV